LSTVEELVDAFVQHGLLLRAAEPEGIALTRSPEEVSAVEILDVLCGPEPPVDPDPSESAVSELIERRERAIQQVMEGGYPQIAGRLIRRCHAPQESFFPSPSGRG
jgi:DNA-binding IscR family transcriptional regulator